VSLSLSFYRAAVKQRYDAKTHAYVGAEPARMFWPDLGHELASTGYAAPVPAVVDSMLQPGDHEADDLLAVRDSVLVGLGYPAGVAPTWRDTWERARALADVIQAAPESHADLWNLEVSGREARREENRARDMSRVILSAAVVGAAAASAISSAKAAAPSAAESAAGKVAVGDAGKLAASPGKLGIVAGAKTAAGALGSVVGAAVGAADSPGEASTQGVPIAALVVVGIGALALIGAWYVL